MEVQKTTDFWRFFSQKKAIIINWFQIFKECSRRFTESIEI